MCLCALHLSTQVYALGATVSALLDELPHDAKTYAVNSAVCKVVGEMMAKVGAERPTMAQAAERLSEAFFG